MALDPPPIPARPSTGVANVEAPLQESKKGWHRFRQDILLKDAPDEDLTILCRSPSRRRHQTVEAKLQHTVAPNFSYSDHGHLIPVKTEGDGTLFKAGALQNIVPLHARVALKGGPKPCKVVGVGQNRLLPTRGTSVLSMQHLMGKHDPARWLIVWSTLQGNAYFHRGHELSFVFEGDLQGQVEILRMHNMSELLHQGESGTIVPCFCNVLHSCFDHCMTKRT